MPAWRWGGRAETAPDRQLTAVHPPQSLALKPQLAVLRQQIILLCYTSKSSCCVNTAFLRISDGWAANRLVEHREQTGVLV